MSAELEQRVRQLERELDELRGTTQRDREQLATLTRDLAELTVALRELRTSLDGWWRDKWPTLEGRLGRIEATTDSLAKRGHQPMSMPPLDWRVIGLIAAALFGGGTLVGGGAGAGLVPMLQHHPAQGE